MIYVLKWIYFCLPYLLVIGPDTTGVKDLL
jgi:hypothetical protein